MFKEREFVGFRFWSWEKKNYLAGKVPWSWRWLHFGWNSLHFQCVDPCKFMKLRKLVCVISEWRNCIYIPPFTRIKLSGAFIWSLSCWPGEMAQQLWVLTLVDDLGLFLSIYLVAYSCPILKQFQRIQLFLLASMGTRHAHVVHLHTFRQNTQIRFSMIIINWPVSVAFFLNKESAQWEEVQGIVLETLGQIAGSWHWKWHRSRK